MTSYTSVACSCLVLRSSAPRTTKKCLAVALPLSGVLGLALRLGPTPKTFAAALLPGVAVVALLSTLVPLLQLEYLPPSAPRKLSATSSEKSLELPHAVSSEPAPFSCPGLPLVPWTAACANVGLMVQLPLASWMRLAVVTGIVLAVDAKHRRNEPPKILS